MCVLVHLTAHTLYVCVHVHVCKYMYTCTCTHSYIHNDLKVALLGPKLDLTYEYEVPLLFFMTVLF